MSMYYDGPDSTEIAAETAEQAQANELASLRDLVTQREAQNETLAAVVERQTGRIALLESLLSEERQSRASFEDRVVQVARDVATEQGWCKAGQRHWLGVLGLELPPDRWAGTFTVEVTFSGLEAENEDDVSDRIHNALQEARIYGVGMDDYDVTDISAEPDEED